MMKIGACGVCDEYLDMQGGCPNGHRPTATQEQLDALVAWLADIGLVPPPQAPVDQGEPRPAGAGARDS